MNYRRNARQLLAAAILSATMLAPPATALQSSPPAAHSGVRTSVLLPFDKSGGKHTQVDQIVIEPGGKLALGGYPEERLYYILDGRGVLSVYDSMTKGDTYVLRSDISLYFTPGLRHEMINSGDTPLRMIVFRVTGGVVPAETADGIASWPTVAKPGVTVEKPAVGTGFWATYVFDQASNASVTEGLHLQVRGLRLRRAQKLATAELLILAPHSQTRPHTHNDTDETLYVLMGEGDFVFDGKKIPFKAGSTISYPAGGARHVENNSDLPIMYISLNSLIDTAAK